MAHRLLRTFGAFVRASYLLALVLLAAELFIGSHYPLSAHLGHLSPEGNSVIRLREGTLDITHQRIDAVIDMPEANENGEVPGFRWRYIARVEQGAGVGKVSKTSTYKYGGVIRVFTIRWRLCLALMIAPALVLLLGVRLYHHRRAGGKTPRAKEPFPRRVMWLVLELTAAASFWLLALIAAHLPVDPTMMTNRFLVSDEKGTLLLTYAGWDDGVFRCTLITPASADAPAAAHQPFPGLSIDRDADRTVVKAAGWLVASALGLLPAIVFIAHLFRRPPHVPGHCRRCGYDLRGSPNKCPECGAPSTPAVAGSG